MKTMDKNTDKISKSTIEKFKSSIRFPVETRVLETSLLVRLVEVIGCLSTYSYNLVHTRRTTYRVLTTSEWLTCAEPVPPGEDLFPAAIRTSTSSTTALIQTSAARRSGRPQTLAECLSGRVKLPSAQTTLPTSTASACVSSCHTPRPSERTCAGGCILS